MAFLGYSLAFIALYLFIVLGISFVLYFLQAAGIYKMSKNMGLPNSWMAFIPILNHYALGRIAEKYIKNDGRPSAKFSKILLILNVISLVVALAFIIFVFILLFLEAASFSEIDAIMYSEEMAAISGITIVLPIILGYFIFVGIIIAFNVVYYVALWRIFALYDNNNATLYLVLTIFFSFLYPIFLFILRNRQPKFTIEERKNIM